MSFGIEATAPETGFGYLRQGEKISDAGYRTAQFIEKPDLERAKSFLAEGSYAWNGGIFAFGRDVFLEELRRHRPEMAALCAAAVAQGTEDGALFRPDAKVFETIRGESIDYAVMENTAHAAMVPVSMGWSDIGSWDALREARGGVSRGPHELLDCSGVMVDSDGPRVSVVGLDDVIIVVDGDEILVMRTDAAQDVGKLGGASLS